MKVQTTVAIDRPQAEIASALLVVLGKLGLKTPAADFVVIERAEDHLVVSGRDSDTETELRATYAVKNSADGTVLDAV